MNEISKKEIKRAANNMMEYFDLTPKKIIRKIAIEFLMGKINTMFLLRSDSIKIGKIPYNILFNGTDMANNTDNRISINEFLTENLISQEIQNKYVVFFITWGWEEEKGDVIFGIRLGKK